MPLVLNVFCPNADSDIKHKTVIANNIVLKLNVTFTLTIADT